MQLVPFRSEISPLHFVPVEMTETADCRRSFTPNTGIQKSVETKLHAFLMSLFLLAEEAEEVNEDVNEIQVQGEGAHDGYLLSFVGGPGMIGEGQAFDGLGVINGEARENQDAGVGNKHLQQGAVEEEPHDRGQDDAEKSHEAHISQLRQIRLRHIAVHRHDAEGAGGHEEHAADGREGVGEENRRQGNAVQHGIHQKHGCRRFQGHFPHGRGQAPYQGKGGHNKHQGARAASHEKPPEQGVIRHEPCAESRHHQGDGHPGIHILHETGHIDGNTFLPFRCQFIIHRKTPF